MDRIYLDYAATTPIRPEVLDAMLPFFADRAYNAGSTHAEGRAARAALDDARASVASVLGAHSKEIIFTSSGSEADNLAIIGAARKAPPGRHHIVCSAIEHHAVLHCADALREEGFDVTHAPVDADGVCSVESLGAALRGDTALASVAYANNEIGTIQPIEQLADAAHDRGALFHCDAIAAAAYLPLDVGALGVDLLSLSGHKFYGPKGVGALWVRRGTPIAPLVHGGSQEFSKRAGTENVAGIVGFARALELAAAERQAACVRLAALRDEFEARLEAAIPSVRIHGAGAARLPNFSSVAFAGLRSDLLLMRLDLEGIAVSAGSACTSGALEPSHVIAALGGQASWARSVVRFTMGSGTTAADIATVLSVLERIVPELRAAAA